MFRLACLVLALLSCDELAFPAAPAPAPAKPKVPQKLLEARRDAANRIYEGKMARFQNGLDAEAIKDLPDWSRRWVEAEKALNNNKKDHLKALEAHWTRIKEVEQMAEKFFKDGDGTRADFDAATYYRIEAEVWLLEAGGKVPKVPNPPVRKGGKKLPPPKGERLPSP